MEHEREKIIIEQEQRQELKVLARKEDARDWLTANVDESSVIDMNWYGYFYRSSKGTAILRNLLAFTGYKNYSELHEKFEGFTVGELLTLP
jgi:hypothetical protein